MNTGLLPTQRKFDEFSGQETVKKTMEIFTELLAQMYIDDQKLTKKDPMGHLMEELNIETEVIDPEILIAENQNIKNDIQAYKNEFSELSKQLTVMRQKRRDNRNQKHNSQSSNSKFENKGKVEIKDIDALSTKNSRKKQSRG